MSPVERDAIELSAQNCVYWATIASEASGDARREALAWAALASQSAFYVARASCIRFEFDA